MRYKEDILMHIWQINFDLLIGNKKIYDIKVSNA